MSSRKRKLKSVPKKEFLVFPSGNELIDSEILQNMDDKTLFSTCSTDKYINSLCNNQEFWRRRLSKLFGMDVRFRNIDNNYREAYENMVEWIHDPIVLVILSATYGGHKELIQYFLGLPNFDEGEIYKETRIPENILHLYGAALGSGSVDILFFLEEKYLFDADTISSLPIHFTLCFGGNSIKPKSAKHLIDKYGKLLDNIDIYTLAVGSGDIVLVESLINRGLELPDDKIGLLTAAILSGSVEMLEYIRSKFTDINMDNVKTIVDDIFPCGLSSSVAKILINLIESFDVAVSNEIIEYIITHDATNIMDGLIQENYRFSPHAIRMAILNLPEEIVLELIENMGEVSEDDIRQMIRDSIIERKSLVLDMVLELAPEGSDGAPLENLELVLSEGGDIDIFETVWKRVYSLVYNEEIFDLLFKYMDGSVQTYHLVEIIQIVKENKKLPDRYRIITEALLK